MTRPCSGAIENNLGIMMIYYLFSACLLIAADARTQFAMLAEVVVEPGARQIFLADVQRVCTRR